MIHFANLYFALTCLILALFAYLYVIFFKKSVTYKYSLTSYFKKNGLKSFTLPRNFLNLLRFLILLILILLVAKIQFPNKKNPIKIDGIDMIITLDVSQSMLCFDDLNDQRSRFDVAKDEAQKFILARKNDAIGLVIFAKQAVTRCPLTMDKNILVDIIKDLKIGYIDGDGTAISRALLTSANRLKNSNAKSKVIIFLTDGCPTVKDVSPEVAIDILKKLNIKVYTIGIGGEDGGYFNHPMVGTIKSQNALNIDLLKKIADSTGGELFLAKSPTDMKNIYKKINELEKNEHTSKIYNNYKDIYFIPIIVAALFLIFIELIFSIFIWFIL